MMKRIIMSAAIAALTLSPIAAHAQAKEQFVPANFYWVGPGAGA